MYIYNIVIGVIHVKFKYLLLVVYKERNEYYFVTFVILYIYSEITNFKFLVSFKYFCLFCGICLCAS